MIAPDALPVRSVGAEVTLDAPAVAALFGRGYALRGTERVRLVRLGRDAGCAGVSAGPLRTCLDRLTLDRLGGRDGVRLVGPAGAVAAGDVAEVRHRLVLPAGLRRAWGVGETATVGLGTVAVHVAVADGTGAGVEVERTLWLAAGAPSTARWLPGVAWTQETTAEAPEADGPARIPRRVVTETDVRQARLRGQRIRLTPGQVVTPAARSLAREWDVFEAEGAGGREIR